MQIRRLDQPQVNRPVPGELRSGERGGEQGVASNGHGNPHLQYDTWAISRGAETPKASENGNAGGNRPEFVSGMPVKCNLRLKFP